MPTYAAFLYSSESEAPAPNGPEGQQMFQAWMAFREETTKAGVLKDGHGVLPTSTATTVRVRDGKTLTTDGPFAETKEQLGGFLILECKDLDEAILWAGKIPHAAYGSVELRPVWQG